MASMALSVLYAASTMTVDEMLDAGAKWVQKNKYPQFKEEKYLPTIRYNLIADLFNGSTVLLTMAVAAVFFGTFGWVVGLTATGLVLRNIVEAKIDHYTFPTKEGEWSYEAFANFFQKKSTEKDNLRHIASRLKTDLPEDWKINLLEYKYPLWKSRVPLEK